LRPVSLGHETTPRFLHTSAHDTVMLVVSMEATLGDCVEEMQMAFPYFTIEPLVRHLTLLNASDKEATTRVEGQAHWNPRYFEIPVPITAEWQGLELSVRALSALKTGDVLMLEPECFNQVLVSLARIRKFRGRLGTRGENWAVEITQAIPATATS